MCPSYRNVFPLVTSTTKTHPLCEPTSVDVSISWPLSHLIPCRHWLYAQPDHPPNAKTLLTTSETQPIPIRIQHSKFTLSRGTQIRHAPRTTKVKNMGTKQEQYMKKYLDLV